MASLSGALKSFSTTTKAMESLTHHLIKSNSERLMSFSSFSQSVENVNQQLHLVIDSTDQLRTKVASPLSITLDLVRFQASLKKVEQSANSIHMDIDINEEQLDKLAKRISNLVKDSMKLDMISELSLSLSTLAVHALVVKVLAVKELVLKSLPMSATDKLPAASQRQIIDYDISKLIDISGSANQSSILALPSPKKSNSEDISEQVSLKTGKFKKFLDHSLSSIKKTVATFTTGLKKVFNFDQLKKLVNHGMQAADEYTNAKAKLNTINDGKQTTSELKDKPFAAANRSGTRFEQMLSTVSDLLLSLPNMFTSNDEAIQFVELTQKAFQLSGQSPSEQVASSGLISNIMKSGAFSGGDFTEIMSTAPHIAEAISNYTGESLTNLQKLAAEGKITSDILKNAMLQATDSINEKFGELPMTFSSLMNIVKNVIFQTIGPALQTISIKLKEAFESDSFKAFINNVAQMFNVLANIGVWVFDLIINNLDIIKNLLAALGIMALITAITMFVAWIKANLSLNLVILAIFALISLLDMLGISTEQVVGFIAGLFMMLFGVVWNVVAYIWNIFVMLAEFIANLFNDPIYAIKKLFYDLKMIILNIIYDLLDLFDIFIRSIIDGINGIIKIMNKVGSFMGLGQMDLIDSTSFITNLKIDLKGAMDKMEPPTSNKDVVNLDHYRMEKQNIGELVDSGYKAGVNMFGNAKGVFDNLSGGDLFKGSPFQGFPSDSLSNVDRVGEVGAINESVDISSEDLKMMRELAEMNNIQNFVSLTPSINFGDTYVRKDNDLDIIVAKITDKLNQDIATSVDAAYR